jgi:hypothetical protein
LFEKFKKWLPAYLWYSGMLMQCVLVLIGLQSFMATIQWRPTHALERDLNAHLSDTEECTQKFVGEEFAWLNPRIVDMQMRTRSAELVQLQYRNAGSVEITPAGHHIYRVWFEPSVKDLKSGEVVRFPPRVEQYFEVDLAGRIVRCVAGHADTYVPAPNLQENVTKACEEKGWARRMACDRGTDRCYPLAQCERVGG